MNVYDFDGTIYDGDSSIDFYLFCIKKKPVIIFKCIFTQLFGAVMYKLRRFSKEQFKESYFCFVKYISINRELLNDFWEEKSGLIKNWYLLQKQPDDVIISASPAFLLTPICENLEINLIASLIDPATGKYTGKNCYGDEKKRRFIQQYPNGIIDKFYTDSKTDMPLISIANKAFMVKGNLITPINDI